MIISGANAGGKTVVLKTAGLLSLMAISGIYHRSLECRTQDIKSHRSTLAALTKQWRDSEFEIVNTTFLSDLDY